MKKYFMLMVLLVLSLYSFSQQQRDAVYLKNGNTQYGTILELIPDSTLKFKTTEGNIFVYKMSEVDKITKASNQGFINKDTISLHQLKKGYKGFFNVHYGLGSPSFVELNTVHGAQINPYFFIGGGIGIKTIDDDNLIFFPMLNARANLNKSTNTSFVDLKMGYGFSKEYGWHINPSFGYRLGGIGAGINLMAGYIYNNGESFLTDENDPVNTDVNIFYIGGGVEF